MDCSTIATLCSTAVLSDVPLPLGQFVQCLHPWTDMVPIDYSSFYLGANISTCFNF